MRAYDSAAKVSASVAASLGFGAGGRYLPNGANSGSCLTAAEAAEYAAANLGLFSLYEKDPKAAAGGSNAGVVAGQSAVAGAKECEQPLHSTITVALWDDDPALLPGGLSTGVDAYRGAAAPVRDAGYLLGGYVSGAFANACLDAGVLDRVLVPGATSWAGGVDSKRADIIQSAATVTIGGVVCDLDTIPDPAHAGLWNGHGLWPVPPKPVPTPIPTPEVDMPTLKVGDHNALVQLVQQGLKILGFFQADPLGNFGAKTDAAVRAFQHFHNLPQGDFTSASWKVLGDRLSKVA